LRRNGSFAQLSGKYSWLFRRICGRENESDVAFGARHVARIAGSGGRPARELRAERR